MNLMEILERAAQPAQPTTQETTMTPLLTDRERTHGIFKDTASLAQSLKDVMRSSKNWGRLSDSQKEALEQDATKTARILSGDFNFRDHWDDKGGYAQLGAISIKPTMATLTADLTDLMAQQQAEPVQQ